MAATVSHGDGAAARPRLVAGAGRQAPGRECTVIELRGEFDAAALNNLVEMFDDAISGTDCDVVIDLAEVNFIGAAWIGTLVRSRWRLEAQNRELTLRSPPPVLHRLLELCGLAYLIEPVSRGAPTAELSITSA